MGSILLADPLGRVASILQKTYVYAFYRSTYYLRIVRVADRRPSPNAKQGVI
jgi:hypothetical protein